MTNLNELQYFYHIAESGSFTVAATQLDLPKSTLSRGLSRLEQRLGGRLIVRSTRRLQLTEAGQVYLEHCRRIMTGVHQGEREISELRATPRGRLRVGAPVLFSRTCLTPLVPEFLERYPEVRLHLLVGEDESNLLESGLDFQIHTGHAADSEMYVRYLGRVPHGLYASPAYIESNGLPESPGDLAEHECITCQESGSYSEWTLTNGSRQVEIRPQPRFSAIDPLILRELAVAGVGVTNIPCWLTRQHMQNGTLVRILPDWEPMPLEVSALYPSPLKLASNARVFLEFLVEKLSFD